MHDANDTGGQGEVEEPENSTVEDWMGQDIARDEEVADRAVAESDSMDEAEARFEQEADGQETHEKGYPRPADEDQSGDGPVGQPS
ncbi:MAG TPA: hypothetical protein VGO60_14000 [Iamia sp.]|nr:hypothetical protein [Iamia sp.]